MSRTPLICLSLLSIFVSCKESVPAESAPGSAGVAAPVAQEPSAEVSADPGTVEAPPAPEVVDAPVPASAEPGVSAAPEPVESLPDVEVKNIGMHIGGGPNDRETKQPIAESVKPHFDALRACWKHVAESAKPGDFGVDLLIPHDGGKASVSNPRSALKGDGFEACVLGVFEAIDFKKPKTGKTMVSYSIRFTPGK